MKSTRRNLILGFLTILGFDPSSLPRLGGRSEDIWAAPIGGAQDSARGPLSDLELEDLVAFAGVLVEGRALSAEQRGFLLDHLGDRTRDPSGYYAGLYRTTARLLNRLAGTRFSSLTPDRRLALLSRYRLTSAAVAPGEPLGPYPDAAREVRTRAVPDLIGGYYGSAAGWAAVGYATFPGRCGDLTRYTRPEPSRR